MAEMNPKKRIVPDDEQSKTSVQSKRVNIAPHAAHAVDSDIEEIIHMEGDDVTSQVGTPPEADASQQSQLVPHQQAVAQVSPANQLNSQDDLKPITLRGNNYFPSDKQWKEKPMLSVFAGIQHFLNGMRSPDGVIGYEFLQPNTQNPLTENMKLIMKNEMERLMAEIQTSSNAANKIVQQQAQTDPKQQPAHGANEDAEMFRSPAFMTGDLQSTIFDEKKWRKPVTVIAGCTVQGAADSMALKKLRVLEELLKGSWNYRGGPASLDKHFGIEKFTFVCMPITKKPQNESSQSIAAPVFLFQAMTGSVPESFNIDMNTSISAIQESLLNTYRRFVNSIVDKFIEIMPNNYLTLISDYTEILSFVERIWAKSCKYTPVSHGVRFHEGTDVYRLEWTKFLLIENNNRTNIRMMWPRLYVIMLMLMDLVRKLPNDNAEKEHTYKPVLSYANNPEKHTAFYDLLKTKKTTTDLMLKNIVTEVVKRFSANNEHNLSNMLQQYVTKNETNSDKSQEQRLIGTNIPSTTFVLDKVLEELNKVTHKNTLALKGEETKSYTVEEITEMLNMNRQNYDYELYNKLAVALTTMILSAKEANIFANMLQRPLGFPDNTQAGVTTRSQNKRKSATSLKNGVDFKRIAEHVMIRTCVQHTRTKMDKVSDQSLLPFISELGVMVQQFGVTHVAYALETRERSLPYATNSVDMALYTSSLDVVLQNVLASKTWQIMSPFGAYSNGMQYKINPNARKILVEESRKVAFAYYLEHPFFIKTICNGFDIYSLTLKHRHALLTGAAKHEAELTMYHAIFRQVAKKVAFCVREHLQAHERQAAVYARMPTPSTIVVKLDNKPNRSQYSADFKKTVEDAQLIHLLFYMKLFETPYGLCLLRKFKNRRLDRFLRQETKEKRSRKQKTAQVVLQSDEKENAESHAQTETHEEEYLAENIGQVFNQTLGDQNTYTYHTIRVTSDVEIYYHAHDDDLDNVTAHLKSIMPEMQSTSRSKREVAATILLSELKNEFPFFNDLCQFVLKEVLGAKTAYPVSTKQNERKSGRKEKKNNRKAKRQDKPRAKNEKGKKRNKRNKKNKVNATQNVKKPGNNIPKNMTQNKSKKPLLMPPRNEDKFWNAATALEVLKERTQPTKSVAVQPYGDFHCPVLASLNDNVFAAHAQRAFDNYVDQTLETAAAAQLSELTF